MVEPRSLPDSLPRAVNRVVQALNEAGHETEIRLLDTQAPTAQTAAAAIGVEMRNIVKSMVFRGPGDRLVLVVLSGDRRVDVARVADELGGAVERADPDWVRAQTGFAIGGIPPVGHQTDPVALIDRGLLAEEVLWAAAGTPNSLFKTSGRELETLTSGVVADVSES